jgi:hypothetical protein
LGLGGVSGNQACAPGGLTARYQVTHASKKGMRGEHGFNEFFSIVRDFAQPQDGRRRWQSPSNTGVWSTSNGAGATVLPTSYLKK